MFDMYVEPWIVGDFGTIGFMEQEEENAVAALIADIKRNHLEPIPVRDFEDMMSAYSIDFFELPSYLQRRIDNEIEVE